MNEKDKLEDMFERQIYFLNKYFAHKLPKRIPKEIPLTITSIIAELGEILEVYQTWKNWRKEYPKINEEDLFLEIVDLWHFIINLTLFLGLDANKLYKTFLLKNKINHERQQNKY